MFSARLAFPARSNIFAVAVLAASVLLGTDATTARAATPTVPASIVTPQELQTVLAGKSASRDADRAAVRALLDRQDVRAAAGRAGLDLDQALARVNTLSDDELASFASKARALDSQIAGGETVVITTTVLTLVLLGIVLLLIV